MQHRNGIGGLDPAATLHMCGVRRNPRPLSAEETEMNSMIQLLVLAGIAVFLILRLRNVLGTREGFEKPPVKLSDTRDDVRREFEVIEGGPDQDIVDHVEDGTQEAKDLAAMKMAEPGFSVNEFLRGSRGAYEMILMGFEAGELDDIQDFLSDEVFETFQDVVAQRKAQGLSIDAEFVGVRETSLAGVTYNRDTQEAEVSVKFVAEITSVVRNSEGEIIEGNANEIKRQKDTWTFARFMGSDTPNWTLVATGE